MRLALGGKQIRANPQPRLPNRGCAIHKSYTVAILSKEARASAHPLTKL
jgi:hypothetical protein